MPEKVNLFVINDMPENEQAKDILRQLNVSIEIIECPTSMIRRYKMPFVKDATDRGYYGLEAIKVFVRRKQDHAHDHGLVER